MQKEKSKRIAEPVLKIGVYILSGLVVLVLIFFIWIAVIALGEQRSDGDKVKSQPEVSLARNRPTNPGPESSLRPRATKTASAYESAPTAAPLPTRESMPAVPMEELPNVSSPPNCPSGTVDFTLSSVVEAVVPGYDQRRQVTARGTIRNNVTVPVDLSMWGDAVVIEIDESGREMSTLYAEIDYTPPAGVQRPTRISVAPGETVQFTATGESFFGKSSGLWIFDRRNTGYILFYSQNQDSRCQQYADVSIDSTALSASRE